MSVGATGRAVKIPLSLDAEILERARRGETSGQIAEWLRTAHGVDVLDRTVRRRIHDRAVERAEATKGTVREKLGQEVTSDLDVLREIREDMRAMAKELREKNPRASIAAARAAADAADKRLHYAGADAEGEELVPGALADLLDAATTEGT